MARKLEAQGFKVRSHPAFSMQPPVDWAADPYDDVNWRYQLNALYPAIVYLEAYQDTGRRKWFDAALDLHLDWIDYNLVRDLPNDFKWYDMATGLRAMYLAVLLDRGLRDGLVSPGEFELLVEAAVAHVEQLAHEQDLAISNHGLYQVAGIAAVCRALPSLRACETARPYANRGFARLLDLQFNAEGMHREHSPGYHHLALGVIDQLARIGWFDLSDRHREALQAARANFHWLVKPDRTYPAIGDTGRTVFGSVRGFHPTLEYLLTDGRKGERPPGGLKIFPETGYGMIRHYAGEDAVRAASYLMMTVAHHSRVHKHADPFAFEWFDTGRSLLIDSGKWGYDRGEERDYIVATRAHNTVEIDTGDDEIEHAPDSLPELSGTVSDDGVYVLMANGERRPSAARHRRLVVLQPGEWLVIADRLAGNDAHDLVQWFHPAETFRCKALDADDAFACEDAGFRFTMQSLMPVDSLRHERGAREPRMQGWVSPAYGKLVPADALGFARADVETGTFVTLVDLAEGAVDSPSVEFTDSALEACWSKGGTRHGVVVTWAGDGAMRVERCNE